jgi:hypothetical protein
VSNSIDLTPDPDNSQLAIVVYHPQPNVSIELPLDKHTRQISASQKQIGDMFDLDVRTISEHIQNYRKEVGMDANSAIRNLRITAADGKSYNVEHYDMDVITYIGYRAHVAPRVLRFRTWVADTLDKAVAPIPPMTPAEILVVQAQMLVDLERRQAADHAAIVELAAIVNGGEHHFTIMGYLIHRKMRGVDAKQAAHFGKLASSLSRTLGYDIGSATDTRYGKVNTYHEDILKSVMSSK